MARVIRPLGANMVLATPMIISRLALVMLEQSGVRVDSTPDGPFRKAMNAPASPNVMAWGFQRDSQTGAEIHMTQTLLNDGRIETVLKVHIGGKPVEARVEIHVGSCMGMRRLQALLRPTVEHLAAQAKGMEASCQT